MGRTVRYENGVIVLTDANGAVQRYPWPIGVPIPDVAVVDPAIAAAFADSFNRTSGPLGPNWIIAPATWTPYTNQISTLTAVIAPTSSGQGLVTGTAGSGNWGQMWPVQCIPVPNILAIKDKSPQFCECTIFDNTLACRGGPMVLCNGAGAGYLLMMVADSNQVHIIRYDSAGANTPIQLALSTTATGNPNERWRLSATVNAGNVTLQVSKNGVVVGNYVDSSAGRLVTGRPILWLGSVQFGGALFNWKNFSCGMGL